jgi:hypothetical protein
LECVFGIRPRPELTQWLPKILQPQFYRSTFTPDVAFETFQQWVLELDDQEQLKLTIVLARKKIADSAETILQRECLQITLSDLDSQGAIWLELLFSDNQTAPLSTLTVQSTLFLNDKDTSVGAVHFLADRNRKDWKHSSKWSRYIKKGIKGELKALNRFFELIRSAIGELE